MTPLRVLWLSPWMRPLARVYAEALQRQGAEVLLVTSDQHPESDTAREYELVLDTRLRAASTWPASIGAWRRSRAFQPDVVITELVRDPRWIAFAGRTSRVRLIHDDRPHDAEEQRPDCEHAVFGRWEASAAVTVTFSDYVATAMAGRSDLTRSRLHTIPLTSDLDPALVGPPLPAQLRRNFVMIGRLNPYKNIDVVLDAWRLHTSGRGWRGDELILLGGGSHIAHDLPEHAKRLPGPYRYREVVRTISTAKGSIAHYRRASQSGVQVLSMQLGVTPIVSTVGALPDFQPPGREPIGVDDVEGLAAVLDELADPAAAALHGATAADYYAHRFAVDHAAKCLLQVLREASER